MNKKLIFTIALVTVFLQLHAQSDSVLRRNIRALQNYSATHPIEKVHLHLDRQLYFPGDTIWFKAYTVIGPEHKLSALSGVLYAELIGPKDSVLKRLNLKLEAGTAPGDFELPYNAVPGTYRIRAYTNYMRNFGADYFYDQPITLAGFPARGDSLVLKQTAQNAPQIAPEKIDLQFFPEGGDLVNGLRSKVAFKAINQNGLAEEVQGSIMDNAGNEVAAFTSRHLGMGAFPLEPQAGKQYFAKVSAADGSKFTVQLPKAKNGGYVLTINNSPGDSVYLKIAAKNVADTAFYLLAQHDGKYDYAASGKITDKTFTAAIAKSRFATGIEQFTLFAQNGEPLNERIIFIQNDDRLKLTVTTDKQSYAPGEQVKVNIQANDKDGQPVTGSFSVSVVDESKVPADEETENTIFSDILLKSEIAGYIQNPGYYFINPNDKTKSDLDLLMLTQGYRRFEWKTMQEDKDSLAYQPEKGFTISGTVTTPAGKPVTNGPVFVTSTKNMLVLDTVTDKYGRFAFNNIMLSDTAKLMIAAKKANGGENVVLKLDTPAYPLTATTFQQKTGNFQNQHLATTPELQLAYKAWKQDSTGHAIMLKEVEVKGEKNLPIHPNYAELLKHSSNLNGPGVANQVIMGSDIKGDCFNLSVCLTSLIRNVVFAYNPKTKGFDIYSTHTITALSGATKPMAVLLNGVISEGSVFDKISLGDIQSIEVLTSYQYLAAYGSGATGGLIIITTKFGDEVNNHNALKQSDIVKFDYDGLYRSKQFYSPRYSTKHPVSLADSRRTIFWQNNIITDGNGQATFTYFNSGIVGSYKTILQGVSIDGALINQILDYPMKMTN